MIPFVSQLSSIGHGCALVLTEKSLAARPQARSWGLEHWVEILRRWVRLPVSVMALVVEGALHILFVFGPEVAFLCLLLRIGGPRPSAD